MKEVKRDLGWKFDNSYIHLPNKLYSQENPKTVSSPKLVVLNKSLAESLGLSADALDSDEAIKIFAGNYIPKGAAPIAQAYAGHQFGHFTMLGDGRAILLGEQIAPNGARFDVQLKGSGRTPYSRGGDGRAALGPMLREYIISEALHNLGIPTTRSLAVITTGEKIVRERYLIGAILTRIASSHIRVGTFQYISIYGSKDELQRLAEYTVQRHYPDIASEENRFLLFIREVIKRQAKLIAQWQLVGFVHGVMNTDNMAISGESIDFGPCAFMDNYDPNTVFSSIDRRGRYAYGNQPDIAAWNLARFAETLLPLIHDDQEEAVKIANEEISDFHKIYNQYWLNGMRAKLGLFNEEAEDEPIIMELLDLMQKNNADFTNTFSALSLDKYEGVELFKTNEFTHWKEKWDLRRCKQLNSIEESRQLMKENNPYVIPRNHRVEEALEAADKGDYSVMEKLVNILANPYSYRDEDTEYTTLPSISSSPYKTFCGT